MPIFFHVLSDRPFGLWPVAPYPEKSLDGGVVGGVIGSPAPGLDGMLPESSVRAPEPDSPEAEEPSPEMRDPALLNVAMGFVPKAKVVEL